MSANSQPVSRAGNDRYRFLRSRCRFSTRSRARCHRPGSPPRLTADSHAVVDPDLAAYSAETVDALGPEALEFLGVALELWSRLDKYPRVTGLLLSGPDPIGCLVYELPVELTERLATLPEEELGRAAQSWLEWIETEPEEAWPGVLLLEDYEAFLGKLLRLARSARERDGTVYLAVYD